MVMTVVGVLAVVAGPSLSRLSYAKRELLAARIRNVLIFAQETAMASDLDTWVLFDANAGQVSAWIKDRDGASRFDIEPMLDPLSRGALVLDLAGSGSAITSVDFNASIAVQFDQDGVPHALNGNLLNRDGTIELGPNTTLRVTRYTGLVTVD